MAEPIRALAPYRQARVDFFHRARKVASFFSPQYGMLVAPAEVVTTSKQAERLVQSLDKNGLSLSKTYELDPQHRLLLKEAGRNMQGLVFQKAPEASWSEIQALDKGPFVLPENLPASIFAKKGAPPRELFWDSIAINRETAVLVGKIAIENTEVARFVAEQLSLPPRKKGPVYQLIYHDYRDENSREIHAQADALVMISRASGGLGRKPITYVMMHKWGGSLMTRLPLESVLEDYPGRVKTFRDMVKASRKDYGDIYDKREVAADKVEFSRLRKLWPFALPKGNLIELKKPRPTLREKWTLYRSAVAKDNIFGLAAIGSLFESAGRGLAEGALLFPLMAFAQNELKVAALLAVLGKASLAAYVISNNRAAAQVEHLEARERMGDKLNKQFPLWEMGHQSKSTAALISRYSKITLAYLGSTLLYLQLLPAVFKGFWGFGTSLLSAGVFMGAFLAAEFLAVVTDAFEVRNSFKLAENRLRNNQKLPEFKRSFWSVSVFQDNLGYTLNQAFLWGGFGLTSLISVLFPHLAIAAGITLGAGSLLLTLARFLLPLFGREEKNRLRIKRADFIRFGRRLEFSENISLILGEDTKVELIEQLDHKSLVIPEYDLRGIKVRIRNLDSIIERKSWLGSILPFAQKRMVIVKTKDPSDPPLVFTRYGGEPLTVDEVRSRYLEII
jgi:hypothetical protein